MTTKIETYQFNGITGCVNQTRSLKTGTVFGVYHGPQSTIDFGFEPDAYGEFPWITNCEEHSFPMAHRTLAEAQEMVAKPFECCWDCENIAKARKRKIRDMGLDTNYHPEWDDEVLYSN